MSSDTLRTTLCVGRTIVFASMLATLAGCQVRPLYSQTTIQQQGKNLAAVSFSDPKNRVEQQIRNNLVFLTSGGAGEPAKADYQVTLNASSSITNILDEQPVAAPTPGRVVLSATYAVTRVSDSKIIRASTKQVTSLVDLSAQEFAKVRAVRDAENRAARELAEFIRADIAIAIAK